MKLETMYKPAMAALDTDRSHNLWMAARALRLEYAKKLAIYELELQDAANRRIDNDEEAKIREYSMSSIHRRNFMMNAIVAKIDNTYLEVGRAIELLGCSRAAMDTMISECKDAKWISLKKNKQGYRRIQATDITVNCWLGYADYATKLSNELGLNYLSASAREIRKLLDNK